jgi:hypothetical protein
VIRYFFINLDCDTCASCGANSGPFPIQVVCEDGSASYGCSGRRKILPALIAS